MRYCTACGTELHGDICSNCGSPALNSRAAMHPPPPDPWANLDELAKIEPANRPQESVSEAVSADYSLGKRNLIQGHDRKMLKLETWFVMVAFLFPAIAGAVIILVEHVSGVADIARFHTYVPHNPTLNMILGIFSYLSIAAVVPVGLLLLARTGQSPSVMGLGWPRFGKDLFPGLGLAAAGFGVEFVMLIPLNQLLKQHPGLVNNISIHHVPSTYVIWGLAISATTAITEEVFVNGYFITRLYQLGWTPKASLILSLTLRTSYHVYYGIGFLLTIPLGYFVTRSFQKHRRLNRAIAAHFIFDAVITTIGILA